MNHDRWRLVVRLKSRDALHQYVDFHRLTGRGLARKADAIARKHSKGERGVGPAIVGHLLSGERSSCSLETAKAIEEALECPPGFLFEPKMSPVADSARHESRVA